uniref:Uncharacterized protein n=1 Tax=Osugoroshi virus TaxID=2202814 RepID=A0A7R7T204_9VIRU|nr:hypothetical protein [Osugoroshi virus]
MADLNSDLLQLINQLSPYSTSPDIDVFEAVRTPPAIPTEHVLPIFVHFADSLEQTQSDIYMLFGIYNVINDPALKPRILRYLYHLHYHYSKLLKSAGKLKDLHLKRLLLRHEEAYPKAKFFYHEDMLQSAIKYGVTIDEFSQIFEPSIVAQYIELRKQRGLDIVIDLTPTEIVVPDEVIPTITEVELPAIEDPVSCPEQHVEMMQQFHEPQLLTEEATEQWFEQNAEAVNDYNECMYVVNPNGDQNIVVQQQSGLLVLKTDCQIYVIAPHDHRFNDFSPLPECAIMGSVIVYVARTARSTSVFSIT